MIRAGLLASMALLWIGVAAAQTVPNGGISANQTWTPAQWNAAWAAKMNWPPANASITAPMLAPGAAAPACSTTSLAGPAPICDAIGFGADPTDTVDSSVAINAALALASGHVTPKDVRLPGGTYLLTNPITVGPNECLVGDSRTTTILTVDQRFNKTATSIVALSGKELNSTTRAPCMHDIQIVFAQPADQSSRSNFLTLARNCTSGPGGTGCKYPPAIDATNSNRAQLRDIAIIAAWDGLNAGSNVGGMWIDNLEVSALDYGMLIDGALDFVHVKGYHFWNFGLTGNLQNIFFDGNTFASKIGKADNADIIDYTVLAGRTAILAGESLLTFSAVELDTNATLEVPAGAGTVIVSGLSSNGSGGTICPLSVNGGIVQVSNYVMGEATPSDVCVNGGSAYIFGGSIANLAGSASAAYVITGRLELHNIHVGVNQAVTWTTPMFSSISSGILVVEGAIFPPQNTAGSPGISIANDNASNAVMNNALSNWTFTPPGSLGLYGVSCTGAPSASYAAVHGVVTHC